MWAELEPLRSELSRDRDVASAWVTLLQASPGRRGALDDVRTVLEAFADDAELVVEGSIALARMAERDPDAPHLHAAALELGDRATARALSSASDAPALLAARGNLLRLGGPSRDAEAVASLERAITREGRGEWLYDLGLCHKWAGRFRAALLAFERAKEKLGATRGVLFNLAICATASGAAEEARDAWRALGHDAKLEPGSLPFVEGLPPIQVRVPTRGSGPDSR